MSPQGVHAGLFLCDSRHFLGTKTRSHFRDVSSLLFDAVDCFLYYSIQILIYEWSYFLSKPAFQDSFAIIFLPSFGTNSSYFSQD